MGNTKIQSLSASNRWLHCTKSLEYNKDFKLNANTLKGNLIHEVSALRLREIFLEENNQEEIDRLKREDYVDEHDKTIIAKWDNSCEKISDGYIEYAIKMAKKYNPIKVEIEQRVDLNWYGFNKYGFIDLIFICEDLIIIIDLKTGRTKVDTKDNPQMLMYAIGKIQQEKKKDNVASKYIISICQPLIHNVEAYEYSLKQVFDWFLSHREVMEEIINDDLHFRPSPSVCKFCDHRNSCNERIKSGVV